MLYVLCFCAFTQLKDLSDSIPGYLISSLTECNVEFMYIARLSSELLSHPFTDEQTCVLSYNILILKLE